MTSYNKIRRTSAHLTAATIGAVAMIGVWLREFDMIDGALGLTVGIAFILATFMIFFTRNADEYTSALWRAGASAAFLVLLACYIFAPALEGFLDGLVGNEGGQDFRADLAPELAFTGFFIAHSWSRLRGTY